MPFVIALLLLATGASGYVLWAEEVCDHPARATSASPLPGMRALM